MHEYDTALKTFLRQGRESLRALTGCAVDRWHNVELPEVSSLRVDLLGESADDRLIHIELQSTNDPRMALRMLEYCAAICRRFDRFPEQVVLYVGGAPLRMTGSLRGEALRFDCRIVDIRELDGERLLESERIGDNIIAVLARVRDEREAVKRILSRIAEADPGVRSSALAGFLLLAGLRQIEDVIEQEVSRMPLLDDILDNKVLGREFRRGLEQGLEQGLQQGLQQGLHQGRNRGRHDGELALLLRQIDRRFGAVPAPLRERLTRMSESEIEAVGLRLLDARNIDELLD
jgi:rhodanese-related sulfurtransferase